MIELSIWEEPNPSLSQVSSPNMCHRCFSAIWSLWSRAGFMTHLDPEPLDFEADLKAYQSFRPTYKLWRVGPYRFEVDYRLPLDIAKWDGTGIVLAAHECDRKNIRTQLPDYWPELTPKTYEISEEPPF